jgi:hypothetical protein
MKFGTLLSNLAKKAGVDTNTQEFIALLSHDIDVPETIATTIDKSLMSLDAAKNNPDVRKAARAEALNGVDSKITELLEELGIEDAADITEEKNSFNKISLLTKKVQALEAKKAGSNKNADKEAIEKQIADLNKELKAAKDTLTAKEKEFQTTRDGDLTNFEIQKLLLGKEYSLPKEMDRDLVVGTAQQAINKALAAKGFNIVRDKESGSLKLLNKEGLAAYSDTNEPLELPSFIDGALAQNKLLKVNDQNQNGGGNNQHVEISGGGKGQGNAAIVTEIESQLFK